MSMASRISARAAPLGLGKLAAGRATCASDAALVANATPAPIPTNVRLVIPDIRALLAPGLKLEADVYAYGELASNLVVVGAVNRRVEHRVGRHHRIAIQRVPNGAEQADLFAQIVRAVEVEQDVGRNVVPVDRRIARRVVEVVETARADVDGLQRGRTRPWF